MSSFMPSLFNRLNPLHLIALNASRRLRRGLMLTGCTGLLAGCHIELEPTEVILEQPLADIEFSNGQRLQFNMGFGSGAYHRPGEPNNIFYTITDRGPNIACVDAGELIGIDNFCGDDDSGKIFPVPGFTPTIYKFALYKTDSGEFSTQILRAIPLRDADFEPISGIVNPLQTTDTENGYDAAGNPLAFDPEGLDTEALVKLKNQTFWLAEEYGPSLIHVSPSGRILQRVVPESVAADLVAANYPVAGLLPEVFKKRKLNRGIESVAVTPDQQYLYFIMQSPLANPSHAAYAASRNVRIMKLKLDKKGQIESLVGEYVYVIDSAQTFANLANGEGDLKDGAVRKQSDVKVSEMLALAEDDLIVLERISKVTKLYRINLAKASNILGSEFDALETSPSLEQRFDLTGNGIQPAVKRLVFNSLTDQRDQALPSKVEGIALLDSRFVLLINDNDFGIDGKTTRAVILPIAEQLTEGEAPSHAQLSLAGTYASGIFDDSAAEIVAFEAARSRIYVVNAADQSVDVLALDSHLQPSLVTRLSVAGRTADGRALGNANSLAISGGLLAVAIEAEDALGNDTQGRGLVQLFNSADLSQPMAGIEVGFLPDMLAFTPDFSKILVANEGEPNDDYDIDPEGSVSIIDLATLTATEVGFSAFNQDGPRAAQLPAGVRVFGPSASVAQDLEPEYIAISGDSRKAYVSLQENNGLAIIDIASAEVEAIVALGLKDFSASRNPLDASNRDDSINIRPWDNLVGMYQPDAIAAYDLDGEVYLVSANEGDARDYDGFSEEFRIKDDEIILADNINPEIKADDQLGRLRITDQDGKNATGEFTTLHAYGARSFSIWNAQGQLLFDSEAEFERLTAERLPEVFNSSNDETDFDDRSDDKGPEPEGLVIGKHLGAVYAFIGLERIGGVMVYDISSPFGPQFVQYINHRDFDADPESTAAGDLGPEGLAFVPANQSPSGEALLIVGNEVSGTTSVYTFK